MARKFKCWKKDFSSENLIAYNKQGTEIDVFVENRGIDGYNVKEKNQKTRKEKRIESGVLGRENAISKAESYIKRNDKC